MLGLIQRVKSASVTVDNAVVGEIGRGILLLLGIQKDDTEPNGVKLINKVLAYRIFPDEKGHMNNSLLDVGGSLLIVSQFTIAADTNKGLRPSFSSAAPPQQAESLYDQFVLSARQLCPDVQTGIFAADMQVAILNDGPVTFMLEC